MLGVNYPFGGMNSNGLCDQTKESIELGYLPNLNDVKAGIDSQAYDIYQGVLSGQNLQSFPSSLLPMSLTGGAFNNANQNPVTSMRDQPDCLEAGGQSTWQSSQCALNREGYDGLSSEDQPSLVHSLYQVTGIPSTNAFDGGGEANSASNDVTQFYAKLQERNTNISSNKTSYDP